MRYDMIWLWNVTKRGTRNPKTTESIGQNTRSFEFVFSNLFEAFLVKTMIRLHKQKEYT